jgi:soluble lytic murein transglycosylase-like protein
MAPYGHIDRETVQCVAKAAQYYEVPELLLHAILQKERGRVGQAVRNRNGTYDLGPAQINTTWLRVFARFGVTLDQVRDDRCTNLYAAGYVLRVNVNHFGGNDWYRATMAYNVGPNEWCNPILYRIAYYYALDVVKRWTVLHRHVFGITASEPEPATPSQR